MKRPHTSAEAIAPRVGGASRPVIDPIFAELQGVKRKKRQAFLLGLKPEDKVESPAGQNVLCQRPARQR